MGFLSSRKIVHTRTAEFEPYDLDGPLRPDISLLRLTCDSESKLGSYMMRMQPGAETIPQIHKNCEQYIILEGGLIESEGTQLGPGDYVIYKPGTFHNSRTERGSLPLAIDTRNEAAGP